MRKGRAPCNAERVHNVEASRRQTLPQALHHEVPALRGQACMPSTPSLGCKWRPRAGEEHFGPHAVQYSACSVEKLSENVPANLADGLTLHVLGAAIKEVSPSAPSAL